MRPAPGRCWSASSPLRRRCLALTAALALAGCTDLSANAALAPAALPVYAVGDSYSFDDGRMERVVGTAPSAVRWQGDAGFAFTTTENVLLPRIEWSDSQVRGARTMAVARNALFPLAPGRTVAFQATRRTVEGTGRSADEVAESWQCRVDGTERVATKAGDFDTFRVVCSMHTVPPGPGLTRTFFYAPAIAYYVRRDDRTGSGTTSTITLTGYTTADPPLTAQAGQARDAARRSALETLPSGQAQPWQDPASGANGTVRPISTAKSPKYGWCRAYQETVEASTRLYRSERVACRTAGGNWQTVSG